jgi:hypothetical protein
MNSHPGPAHVSQRNNCTVILTLVTRNSSHFSHLVFLYLYLKNSNSMVVESNDKLILVTNDDGLYAAGLKTLLEIMEEFGKVILISTLESMSGMSQALTVKVPLRVRLIEETDKHRYMHATAPRPTA